MIARNKLEKEKLIQLANMFDLADVIEILTDYSVLHSEFLQPDISGEYLGLQDGTKRKIYIDSTFGYDERRKTVIHELYHVENLIRHFSLTEQQVGSIANIIDHRLFGPGGELDKKPNPEANILKSRLEKIADEFRLIDIVDVLTEYSLIHTPLPDQKEIRYGYTDWSNRSIYINSTLAYHKRRNAIIHKSMHVHDKDHHLGLTEKQMQAAADLIDRRLFKRSE